MTTNTTATVQTVTVVTLTMTQRQAELLGEILGNVGWGQENAAEGNALSAALREVGYTYTSRTDPNYPFVGNGSLIFK